MTIERVAADEPFFREWKLKKQGARRSLRRAQLVKAALDLDKFNLPLLTVVGSKGKATAALYAAATITAAGLRTGSLTSPPIISNRERIRVNGHAISERDYQELSRRLAAILDDLRPEASVDGYLSPSGLFTLMGLRYMLEEGCEAVVLEAGMGGRSDEASLFPPAVVAVTGIFGEHLGLLGKDIVEIAQEKIGIVAIDSTRSVLTLPQSPTVSEVITTSLDSRACDLTFVTGEEETAVHDSELPHGLSRSNAVLGIRAGERLLELNRRPPINPESLRRVLSTIKTPGRLSLHQDEAGRTWIVDAAINEAGVAAALNWTEQHLGAAETVLVSIPSGKDVTGVRRALGPRSYIPVSISTEHLNFEGKEWDRDLISFEEANKHITGTRILALGTWSFIGAVLNRLGVNHEIAYLTAETRP